MYVVLKDQGNSAVEKFVSNVKTKRKEQIDLLVNSAYGGLTANRHHILESLLTWERPIYSF